MEKNCTQCKYFKLKTVGFGSGGKVILIAKCKFESDKVVTPSINYIPDDCQYHSPIKSTKDTGIPFTYGGIKPTFDLQQYSKLVEHIGTLVKRNPTVAETRNDLPLEVNAFDSSPIIAATEKQIPPPPPRTSHLFRPNYLKETTRINLTDTLHRRVTLPDRAVKPEVRQTVGGNYGS